MDMTAAAGVINILGSEQDLRYGVAVLGKDGGFIISQVTQAIGREGIAAHSDSSHDRKNKKDRR